MKRLLALALVLLMTACAPSAASPSPTSLPTSTPTAQPTTTPSSAPPASAPATPTGTPIALPTSASVSAPSGSVVWTLVASTRLFVSGDRGATWLERSLPPQIPIGDVAFINDREGWLSSPGSSATQCQTQAVSIWHTVDGASTWERLYQADSSDTMCKGGLWFADAQRGFLTLTSPNTSTVIERTTDGGRTWTRSQPLPDPPGYTSGASAGLQGGRVKTFGSTLLVGALGLSGTGKEYAFRSSDGANWTYASTGPILQIDLVFVSAARWLQVFLPNQSSETTDGGASWHSFTTDYAQAAPVSPQMPFGDDNVGYATVRGSIQRTTDGGAHWTGLKTPGT